MMDIKEYIETVKPKKFGQGKPSKLHKYSEDISTLLEKGYPVSQICEYLNSKGCDVKYMNLFQFIKRHLRKVK